jgi:UDP-N-acetylmuramoyl-tripeptide--D-alanyl-D-alanine ligase
MQPRAHGLTAQRRRLRRQVLYVLASVWRRALFRTTFIAVTGSLGKTTAKECIAGILQTRFRTAKTLYNENGPSGVSRTVLRVKPWHRFAVVEVGTDRPGMIAWSTRLIRPRIAVVLTVARTHTRSFLTLEETAAEKARILEALPPDGLAILNFEDPRVRQMATGCCCRVKSFGRSPRDDLRVTEVSAQWPGRLMLQVCTASETQWIKTNFVGEQWVNSVLAALLTAHSCGIDLAAAAPALERVEPFMARMQPVQLPSGAIMLRDEYNGSADTWGPALAVLKAATVGRRILVASGISDTGQRISVHVRELGQAAAGAADLAVFIGEHAQRAARAAVRAGMAPGAVVGFADLQRGAAYLKSELRRGDLVLSKGRTTDHLERVFFAQVGAVRCRRATCSKTIVCDLCPELTGSSKGRT